LLPGRRREDEDPGFGTLRGAARVVVTDDGTPLHVEVDELDRTLEPRGSSDAHAAEPDESPDHPVEPYGSARTSRGGRHSRNGRHQRADRGDQPLPAPTIVFCHGYALTMDSWHYQRAALRGHYRMVFWDQRGHGRSGPGPDDSATIDQIGRDLGAVIDAVAPDGPLVLIGHSMGGMTVMSLAAHRPELVRERVIGVALVSTSAGGLGEADYGLAGFGRLVNKYAPAAMKLMARTPRMIERTRRIGSDLETFMVKKYSYASDVPASLVRFTARMIASTRVEVISDFMPTFGTHDKREALAVLAGREVLVLVGDADLLIPAGHSADIVTGLAGAEHVVVPHGGHLVMLEHPSVVTPHLLDLVERSISSQNRPTPRLGPSRPSRRVNRSGRPDGAA
jgi:pimeloyl-ACP methyl ester carboxylesterase